MVVARPGCGGTSVPARVAEARAHSLPHAVEIKEARGKGGLERGVQKSPRRGLATPVGRPYTRRVHLRRAVRHPSWTTRRSERRRRVDAGGFTFNGHAPNKVRATGWRMTRGPRPQRFLWSISISSTP